MKIMLSAGEASGDLHGAHLIERIRDIRPDAVFFGMGGKLMGSAGMETVYDPTRLGAFGLVEIIRLLPLAGRIRKTLVTLMEESRPDVLVLIDYPGFNMRLAREAHARGIRCVYYFSPSAWAWKPGRAKVIARTVTRVASVFPFEEEVYRKAGADVVYVGHPLKDIVKREMSDAEFHRSLALDPAKPILALCPGSRAKEVASLFPVMVGVAARLCADNPDLQVVCPVAPTVDMGMLKDTPGVGDIGVRFHQGSIHDLFGVARLAMVASGTATLEAAICGCPMIIVYRISNLSYHVFKRLVKLRYVGLPNIVAGRGVVPELIQDDFNADNLYDHATRLLCDDDANRDMRVALAGVSESLGQTGAVSRAARVVVDVAEGK